jgi:hypothetical protein
MVCCWRGVLDSLITERRHALLDRQEGVEEQVCRLSSGASDILVVVFQQPLEDVKLATQRVIVSKAVVPVSRLPRTNP